MQSCKQSMFVFAILAAFIATIALLPARISAGDLEPPPEAVDQNGDPVPTMKTLNQINPTWSQKLPTAERFELVLCNQAVLDKETGLVWQRFPTNFHATWANAIIYCHQLNICNRMGWRLPTIDELTSLVDRSQSVPALPSGYEAYFTIVDLHYHWSSTTAAHDATKAWRMTLHEGAPAVEEKNYYLHHWCVRGGQRVDAD